MIIHVRKKHILKGLPFRPELCPVALAIKEATGIDVRIRIDNAEVIDPITKRIMCLIDLPEHVAEFITTFDRDKPVKPISFKLC